MTLQLRKRTFVLVCGVAALAFPLTACSGDGKKEKKQETTTQGDSLDSGLKMAQCMREHGIDMPDPKPGSDGRALTIEPGGKSQEELSAALKECGKSSGAGGANTDANGELTQEFKDQQLKYAQCMREKGIDMPDPKFDGGMQAAQAMPMDEAGKQKFEDANKACGAGGPAGDAADEAK